jgi:hypothetical protein
VSACLPPRAAPPLPPASPPLPVTVRGKWQDNVRVVGDIQRSLVTIASAWHACLEHAAGHQPP